MLVRFALDVQGLAMPWLDGRQRIAAHRRLLKEWKDAGRLVLPEPSLRESALLAAVEKLPPALRDLWMSFWRHCERTTCGVVQVSTPTGAAVAESLPRLRQAVDVFCAGHEQAREIGVPADSAAAIISGLEVVLIDLVEQSSRFQKARELAALPVEAGVSTSEVWNTIFLPLARDARIAVLVDRYAMGDRKFQVEQNRWPGGMMNFLRRAAEVESLTDISLFVFIWDAYSSSDLAHVLCRAKRFLEELPLTRANFTLHVVPDEKFKGQQHARWLRFDDSVIVLDEGIRVLQGETLGKRYELKRRPKVKSDWGIERDFATASRGCVTRMGGTSVVSETRPRSQR